MANYLHTYTQEQRKFLADNIEGRSYRDLTDMFNSQFGTMLNIGRISASIKRYGLVNGRVARFVKGQESWNKGRYGVRVSPDSEFKKGHMPHNHKPVGSERVSKDGYLEVKVAEPKKWMGKHRVVWEKENGPIPAGHVVIFADGDKRNLDPDNLILASRGELAILNKKGLLFSDAELTKSGVLVAKLIKKAGERK